MRRLGIILITFLLCFGSLIFFQDNTASAQGLLDGDWLHRRPVPANCDSCESDYKKCIKSTKKVISSFPNPGCSLDFRNNAKDCDKRESDALKKLFRKELNIDYTNTPYPIIERKIKQLKDKKTQKRINDSIDGISKNHKACLKLSIQIAADCNKTTYGQYCKDERKSCLTKKGCSIRPLPKGKKVSSNGRGSQIVSENSPQVVGGSVNDNQGTILPEEKQSDIIETLDRVINPFPDSSEGKSENNDSTEPLNTKSDQEKENGIAEDSFFEDLKEGVDNFTDEELQDIIDEFLEDENSDEPQQDENNGQEPQDSDGGEEEEDIDEGSDDENPVDQGEVTPDNNQNNKSLQGDSESTSKEYRENSCPNGTQPDLLGRCVASLGTEEGVFDIDPTDQCPAGTLPGAKDQCEPVALESLKFLATPIQEGQWVVVCPAGTKPGPVDACIPAFEKEDASIEQFETNFRNCPAGTTPAPDDGGCIPIIDDISQKVSFDASQLGGINSEDFFRLNSLEEPLNFELLSTEEVGATLAKDFNGFITKDVKQAIENSKFEIAENYPKN